MDLLGEGFGSKNLLLLKAFAEIEITWLSETWECINGLRLLKYECWATRNETDTDRQTQSETGKGPYACRWNQLYDVKMQWNISKIYIFSKPTFGHSYFFVPLINFIFFCFRHCLFIFYYILLYFCLSFFHFFPSSHFSKLSSIFIQLCFCMELCFIFWCLFCS